jgi:hypothetical protein
MSKGHFPDTIFEKENGHFIMRTTNGAVFIDQLSVLFIGEVDDSIIEQTEYFFASQKYEYKYVTYHGIQIKNTSTFVKFTNLFEVVFFRNSMIPSSVIKELKCKVDFS